MLPVGEARNNMNIQKITCRLLSLFLLILKFSACTSNNQTEDQKIITKVSKLWIGSWIRNEYQNPGKLEILNVNYNSIQFELHASNGGHESSVEGIAIATDTTIAIFSSKESNDSCKIEFRLIGDSIVVKEVGNKCVKTLGVVFDGIYKNENNIKVEDEEYNQNKSLFDIGIFKTEIQDSIFRALVEDKYSLFVETTQLTSEDDDLDSLNVVVKSSGVRGLFTQMENIIMIDLENNMWAAVIDDKQRVLYFTNGEAFKNKLPKTIENWRRNFIDYPVICK